MAYQGSNSLQVDIPMKTGTYRMRKKSPQPAPGFCPGGANAYTAAVNPPALKIVKVESRILAQTYLGRWKEL